MNTIRFLSYVVWSDERAEAGEYVWMSFASLIEDATTKGAIEKNSTFSEFKIGLPSY